MLRFARVVPKRSEPCCEASLTLEVGQARSRFVRDLTDPCYAKRCVPWELKHDPDGS